MSMQESQLFLANPLPLVISVPIILSESLNRPGTDEVPDLKHG